MSCWARPRACALSPEYEDVQLIEASNGAQAFFSTKYLTRDYAQSLLEWIEVEEPANP